MAFAHQVQPTKELNLAKKGWVIIHPFRLEDVKETLRIDLTRTDTKPPQQYSQGPEAVTKALGVRTDGIPEQTDQATARLEINHEGVQRNYG